MKDFEKSCSNCHKSFMEYGSAPDCNSDCMFSFDHPAWEPMTNGDRVREMTDEDLAWLYSGSELDTRCREKFLDWLKAPAENIRG